MIQYELALQTRTLPGKEVFVVLNHRAFVQRGRACSHMSSGRVRALSSQGKKKKNFIQPGVQTEQTEHQDQARTVLSSQRLSAKEKATRAHLLTHTHLLRRGR